MICRLIFIDRKRQLVPITKVDTMQHPSLPHQGPASIITKNTIVKEEYAISLP